MSAGVSECAIDWVRGDKKAGVTAYSSGRIKGQIERLAEKYPDEVEILERNADGSIFAHVPVAWVKVAPPRKISEAQRLAAAERLAAYRIGAKSAADVQDDDEDVDEDEIEEDAEEDSAEREAEADF